MTAVSLSPEDFCTYLASLCQQPYSRGVAIFSGWSILSKPKNIITIVERSDVVYKIPCYNCDMCYIGETSKQVKFRVEEHRKNITQHHQPSLIYQHIAQEHHDINWNNVSILNKHQNTYSGNFLEACHAQVTPPKFQHINHITHNIYSNYTKHFTKFFPIGYHCLNIFLNFNTIFIILTKLKYCYILLLNFLYSC